jgi:hypothetical protein
MPKTRGPKKEGYESVRPLITRDAFAKISEVEDIRLSDEGREIFAEFDRRGLSAEERRRSIIARFKREAAE